jgi:hypothetical protein
MMIVELPKSQSEITGVRLRRREVKRLSIETSRRNKVDLLNMLEENLS